MKIRNCDLFTAGKVDIIDIINQAHIEACGQWYRADFLLPVIYTTKERIIYKNFLIECDEHDFHEKTKEQVQQRNQRDRDLTACGFEIIHFSGGEIYKNARTCVKEILKIIVNYPVD